MYRASLVLTGLLALPLPAGPGDEIRLDPMSYADLVREAQRLKGKVVLVDVWGTFCAPCMEKFPQVVRWHDRHSRDGLAVISVCVDPPEDADAREAAREFLAKQRATCRNVILTDPADVWQKRWKVDGPPLLFLFDRSGRLDARWEGKFEPAEVEKRMTALLRE